MSFAQEQKREWDGKFYRVQWTDEMINTLRSMRTNGEPLLLCSEKIGVSYPTAVYKARELGIADRMNRGRYTGRDLAAGKKA